MVKTPMFITGDLSSNLGVVFAFRCWPKDAEVKGETQNTPGGMNKSRTPLSCKKKVNKSQVSADSYTLPITVLRCW